jgi:hypothetical protein
MEAMNWIGKTSEAVEAMTSLVSITGVRRRIRDCHA